MSKQKTTFTCTNCNQTTTKWYGQCATCKEWGTLEETQNTPQAKLIGTKTQNLAPTTPIVPAQSIQQILQHNKTQKLARTQTGINEFDRVTGGGLVPGGVILLAGEPGAGKSTLLTTIAHHHATKHPTLIISGEESESQIALRAERIGATNPNLYIAHESDLTKALAQIENIQPKLIIIDSIQTIASPTLDSRIGERSQVIEVATILSRTAKTLNTPMIMVGHVTKDGNIAGPRTIEHLVDAVLTLEGDQDTPLKLLRSIKNRYGSTEEIGCFQHTNHGIEEVPDPSGLLISRHTQPMSGVMTGMISEGRRALPVEVQALVTNSSLPVPRRAFSGVDTPRATMILAILEKHGRLRISGKDTYIALTGGLKTREPTLDVATAVAVASSFLDYAMPPNTICLGEMTLTGEVRPVPGIDRHLHEAERLGFTQAIIPTRNARETKNKTSLTLHPVSNVISLLEKLESIKN